VFCCRCQNWHGRIEINGSSWVQKNIKLPSITAKEAEETRKKAQFSSMICDINRAVPELAGSRSGGGFDDSRRYPDRRPKRHRWHHITLPLTNVAYRLL
jgi:hypothetical protein